MPQSPVAATQFKPYSVSVAEYHKEFWQRHPGLVWSNPEADDTVRIRSALMRPRFDRLLDIALEFGVERLASEWTILEQENTTESRRAQPSVKRILTNIKQGFSSVASGN